MEQVLLVVQVILAVGLIGMVLIQRSDSDGFGLGGNSGGGLLSGRAQANLMTRTTAIFAALFIINSLALSVLAANGRTGSIVDTIEQQQKTDAKGAPVVPTDGDKKADKADKKVAPAADKKPEVKKEAPAVPTDADAKPAEKKDAPAEEKPAAPVKKAVKKAAPKATSDEAPADHNE